MITFLLYNFNNISQSKLPKDATCAPIIIATDKTQLTQFVGGKSAYPVYLTLGNIPKGLRRKPSERACILIGYLPVDTAILKSSNLSQQKVGIRNQRLFHEAMRIILEPLIKAGTEGVLMTGGDGAVRRVYPILACYVADFPEQCLVSCSKYGTCPKCRTPANDLQNPTPATARSSKWTLDVIKMAKASGKSSKFYQSCMSEDVSGSVYVPFWKDLPLCNIHQSITPDVLHQLYQGVLKYLISWCQSLMTIEELDARVRSLPPAFGVRHFKNGFSVLSQIQGPERKHMAKILLGCLVGSVASDGIKAIKALLDFIYIAQYKTHNGTTLQYLQDALDAFHAHKDFFIETTLRPHLNIPKFHSLLHYIESIKFFGTTDNYNTEAFERFHIDFAKEGWRASNHRDEFPQMINWLSRQEKISMFESYMDNMLSSKNPPSKPTLLSQRPVPRVAKFPPFPSRHLTTIETKFNAPHFSHKLKEYLNKFTLNPASRSTLPNYPLPFQHVDVYSQFKFNAHSLWEEGDDPVYEPMTVKALPISTANPHGRFDTIVALWNDDAESTGVVGMSIRHPFQFVFLHLRIYL